MISEGSYALRSEQPSKTILPFATMIARLRRSLTAKFLFPHGKFRPNIHFLPTAKFRKKFQKITRKTSDLFRKDLNQTSSHKFLRMICCSLPNKAPIWWISFYGGQVNSQKRKEWTLFSSASEINRWGQGWSRYDLVFSVGTNPHHTDYLYRPWNSGSSIDTVQNSN